MSIPNPILQTKPAASFHTRSDLNLSAVPIHQLTASIDRMYQRPAKKRRLEESSPTTTTTTLPDGDAFTAEVQKAILLFKKINGTQDLLKCIEPSMRNRVRLAAIDIAKGSKAERRERHKEERRKHRDARKERDNKLRQQTGIRVLRAQPVFRVSNPLLPPPQIDDAQCEEPKQEYHALHRCYICKQMYKTIHSFYDQLCPECGDFNFRKRIQTADLKGRTALVTGGRVKIGYQAALMLLHAGAKVIVVTRFPRDAATRFSKEEDFAVWKDRLEIFGLDLRHTPSVEAFCKHLCATESRLDFLINNACQTVRRPAGFYSHLMEGERQPFSTIPGDVQSLLQSYEEMKSARKELLLEASAASTGSLSKSAAPPPSTPGISHAAEMSQLAVLQEDLDSSQRLFPKGQLDADLQQVDLRLKNSWRLRLAEVQTGELLEVQLVNVVAPFVLAAKLKPLMMSTPERDKHIVNVSAVEGQFYRSYKTFMHPHTNMAKAALNMMTRTSAVDYMNDGIFMNSVDTGWVTDENPAVIATRSQEDRDFSPPLDIVDGAARVLDPIFSGFNTGVHVWGQFLKDYKPAPW